MNELYKGGVLVKFNEGSHRYSVSLDKGKTWDYKPGVTGILGRILAKEALMLWPMDEALKYLFGQKFEEETDDNGDISVKPIYDPSKAAIQAGATLSERVLQNLLEEARSAHTKKRDKGGDVGHQVHDAIESALKNGEANVPSNEAGKAFNAWVKWYYDLKPEVLEVERVVYSETYDFCGTLDAIIEIDGEKVLCDWKTSNYSRTAPKGIYADNFIQLGGYALAYEEEFGEGTIQDLLIVNASKQGKVNAVYGSELGINPRWAMELFKRTLALHDGRKYLETNLKEK